MGDGTWNGPTDIRGLVQWMRGRLKRDNDAVIAICGETGTGKSSLAVLLAPKIQDHAVSVEDQFLWASDGLLNASRRCPERSVLVMDEAIAGGGNRRRAMSGANVDVMVHLNTCRTFHQAVFFLAPQFADLDNSIQSRCKWLIQVDRRGEFTAYSVDRVGGPRGRGIWTQARFKDKFPDPRKHRDPEVRGLWAQYLNAKQRFSMRGADATTPLRAGFKDRCVEIIREVLSPWQN